jgi:hypothetical protein
VGGLLRYMAQNRVRLQLEVPEGTPVQTQLQETHQAGPPEEVPVGSQPSTLDLERPYGPWGAQGETEDVGQYGPGHSDEEALEPPYQPGPAGDDDVENPAYGPGPGAPPADAPAGPNEPSQPAEPPKPGPGTGTGSQNGTGSQGGNSGSDSGSGGDGGNGGKP